MFQGCCFLVASSSKVAHSECSVAGRTQYRPSGTEPAEVVRSGTLSIDRSFAAKTFPGGAFDILVDTLLLTVVSVAGMFYNPSTLLK